MQLLKKISKCRFKLNTIGNSLRVFVSPGRRPGTRLVKTNSFVSNASAKTGVVEKRRNAGIIFARVFGCSGFERPKLSISFNKTICAILFAHGAFL